MYWHTISLPCFFKQTAMTNFELYLIGEGYIKYVLHCRWNNIRITPKKAILFTIKPFDFTV